MKQFLRRAARSYVKDQLSREAGPIPDSARVSIDKADYVILSLCGHTQRLDLKAYLMEIAMAQEMAAAGKTFAWVTDPATIFRTKVYWAPPDNLYQPKLWDYSKQCVDFVKGLESQENQLFISSEEAAFWENKSYMHTRFDEVGIPSPRTVQLSRGSWPKADLPPAPLLLKEEHSAGSSGIHFFATHDEARQFLKDYKWAPNETVIAQQIVSGASRDLRLTMVGDKMIPGATYWRTKTGGSTKSEWTTTATTYNSLVDHIPPPEGLTEIAAGHMRKLGIRTAGIDVMYENDDVTSTPLILELSPLYQPNPPKPERYKDLSYKEYKKKLIGKQTYLAEQHRVYRDINREILSQGLF